MHPLFSTARFDYSLLHQIYCFQKVMVAYREALLTIVNQQSETLSPISYLLELPSSSLYTEVI